MQNRLCHERERLAEKKIKKCEVFTEGEKTCLPPQNEEVCY